MFKKNETIFGVPSFFSEDCEKNKSFSIDFDRNSDFDNIINFLSSADINELINYKNINNGIDRDVINYYIVLKDNIVKTNLENNNYELLFKRLRELEIIPNKDVTLNNLMSCLKSINDKGKSRPQSLFALGFAVAYILVATGIYLAVNAGAVLNVGAFIYVETTTKGYKRIKSDDVSINIINVLSPKLINILPIFREYMSDENINEFLNYTIHEMLKENAIRECIRSYVEKGELLKNEKLSLN